MEMIRWPWAFLCLAKIVNSLDNGIAITPPMGWRSWNCYGVDISQREIEAVADVMSSSPSGENTSLVALGYTHLGIDDGWQECNSGSEPPSSFHDSSGRPIVNTTKFPQLPELSPYCSARGLQLGWYENNCYCHESKARIHNATWVELTYRGDVEQLVANNFHGVKLDSCGLHSNVSKYSELINASGRPMLIENCHQGDPATNPTNLSWCPFNLYRTSGDIRASFSSIVRNLNTVFKYTMATPPLSRPGCWAYPDMLQVGNLASFEEDRTHFGLWCIVSAPLILGFDLRNATTLSRVWPIVTNTEAIAINQAWAGDPGRSIVVNETEIQVVAKKLSDNSQAVFVFNNAGLGSEPVSVQISLNKLEVRNAVTVRDVWEMQNKGVASEVINIHGLQPHDSKFFVLTASPSQSTE